MIDRLRNRRPAVTGEAAPEPAPAVPVARASATAGAPDGKESPAPDGAAEDRAAAAAEAYMRSNATNVERAARFAEQAGRLESEGTPSDSARNRAERAKEEVSGGLADLRASLVVGGDAEAAAALDRVVGRLYPAFEPSGSTSL